MKLFFRVRKPPTQGFKGLKELTRNIGEEEGNGLEFKKDDQMTSKKLLVLDGTDEDDVLSVCLFLCGCGTIVGYKGKHTALISTLDTQILRMLHFPR